MSPKVEPAWSYERYNPAVRILLLNLYYPPDTSATAKMAKAVVNALCDTHQVTIVCGRPSYDPTERRGWYLWQTEHPPQSSHQKVAKIIRVGSTDYPRSQMRQRVLNYLTYVGLSVPRAIFEECDLVLAMTDPPFEGIAAAFVAMMKRKPYVYNIRDLYPDMAVAGTIMEAGLISRLWEMLHRWALKRAKRVIVLGEDMRTRVATKGVKPERLRIVRDGTSFSESAGADIDLEVVRQIRATYGFVIVHAGNLGFYGAWQTLIDGMRTLNREEIGLVFVGEGAHQNAIRSAASGCKNVRFLPFFPVTKIPSVMAAGDIHAVTIKRGLEGVIVPSKMYEILHAGKPILAVAPRETDVASIGERDGFAVWADPEDPSMLAEVVGELFNNRPRLERMSAAARVAASGYDRVNEMGKFAQVIEEASAE